MQDRDTLNPKAKKVKQVAWLIGTIQDLARDIEQDATRILVYKDKKGNARWQNIGCDR